MDKFTLAEAKSLCTASELRIVTTSMGSRLEKLDAAGLKKHIVEARKQRDKWRDVATTQRRQTQRAQGSRTSDANARSQQKSQLFDEVLARFEAQLKQVESTAAPLAPAATSTKAAPTKRERSQEHRQSRATVRDALREKQQILEAKKKKTPVAKVEKPAAKVAKKKPASSPPAKVARKKTKKVPQKTPPPVAPAASMKMADTLAPNPAKNRAAVTAAKKARLRVSGLSSRTKGHVSAQTRRRQSKRDARG